MLKNVYIGGGARTPFGSLSGSLSALSAAELGVAAVRETVKRCGVEAKHVDEVIFGNVIGAGLGQNIARQVAVGAGLGVGVGASTVNKVCGSGLRAIIAAAQAIQCGDAHLIVAGGCESMSNAPYLLPKARAGYRMGHGQLIDSMIHDGLWDVYTNQHMGNCGELCARKYNFSREEQDGYAIESFQRSIRAWEDGFLGGEVVPVEVKTRKGSVVVDRDEDIGKFQGADKLRALKPAFGSGTTITAGNASGINDGAGSMMVFDDERKEALGLKPAARILGHASAALESDWFTIAPIYAIRKLCQRLDLQPSDVDLYEINEAFAVVAMVAIRELKLDDSRVNVAGGAVALGHPIGATGARLVITLIRSLERRNQRLGIACACIGGGEATAVAVERCA
jgi:acetyl-CoA C-acetyltransferase